MTFVYAMVRDLFVESTWLQKFPTELKLTKAMILEEDPLEVKLITRASIDVCYIKGLLVLLKSVRKHPKNG